MCQEGGRRSKKILQAYLNTMIDKTDAGSQNEKTMVDPKKIPKTPENTDDEQEPAAKQLKKAPKTLEG